MQQSIYNSPLGPLFFWFQDGKLIYATFHADEGKRWLLKHFPFDAVQSEPLQTPFEADLDAYFRGQRVDFNWPLILVGTAFQKQIWQEIKEIRHGQLTTYKKIAERLDTKAFQAVGQAVGANPISLIIPCHRVLGTNWFGGYGGGLNLKRLLLELENVTLVPNLNA